MNMKSAALAASATLALRPPGPAMAADNGFYLGAGISQAKTELSLSGLGSDDVDDTGFQDHRRLANHYTGHDYRNRKNARVSAWIGIDRWHGWGSPNVKR